MKIETKTGSATSAVPGKDGVIIAHLCNNKSRWGAGFVLAVNELSLAAKHAYTALCKEYNNDVPLGITQFVELKPNLWAANMIAQNGIDKSISPNGCLVDYKALNQCLKTTFQRAVLLGCNVHIPSGMGSGLAGGDKQMIHDLIETRADTLKPGELDDLETMLEFVPQITLWDFDDTTAASYVGKPTASTQSMVSSVFGTPDEDENSDDDFLKDI